jgi:hypothetical protein
LLRLENGLGRCSSRLDEAGDLRRPGPRHVHEHQEQPFLAVVELADVDGGGAAIGAQVAAVGARLDFLEPDAPG